MLAKDFLAECKRRIFILDGATGTELAKQGMPAGVCPELWVLEHPEAINAVQSAYKKSGSNIVYSPTFGGNRIKLAEYGAADRLREINMNLVKIAKAGVGENTMVFGDISSCGKFVEPFGEMPFEEAVDMFKEQAAALLEGGVDGFAIETMMDLQEARAALLAVRELAPDITVFVTMTFDESGRTLTGNAPESCMIALQALGATAVGCNCSAGPEQMASVIAAMKSVARVPVIAKPNAGMPHLVGMRTVFDMGASEFGEAASKLVAAGASIVGGCCGTTPEHIKALVDKVSNIQIPEIDAEKKSFIASGSMHVEIGRKLPFRVIGERLNPTGKKALQAELREGKYDLVRRFAREQAENGACMLDVNCGTSGINEAESLRTVVSILANESSLPLCIDTTDPVAAEAAMRLYPGRVLFNSISAEKNRLEKVLPIAAKYGAHIVILPLSDSGIPSSLAEFEQNLKIVENAALALNIGHADLTVDALVMTVSADAEAALKTLDRIEWINKTWRGSSVCGLSNVSFGLPRRDIVNRAFLGMAIGRGLSMAIANPMNADIMEMAFASDVLGGQDAGAEAFITRFGNTCAATQTTAGKVLSQEETAFNALVNGDSGTLASALDAMLAAGKKAGDIVNGVLIPAISNVGDKYEHKEFFLPQLMKGALAMQGAMTKLEPLLSTGDSKQILGRIVIATVKGDIHDIGKNIVIMLLKNYGFEVIDLGKDVPAEKILDTAVSCNAKLIGLSALMTTTMGEMRNVSELAKKRGMNDVHFIVGGAVVDEEFAASIGASYASDAMATVRIATELCK